MHIVVYTYSHKQLQVDILIYWFIYMVFSEELDLYRTGKKRKVKWKEFFGRGYSPNDHEWNFFNLSLRVLLISLKGT